APKPRAGDTGAGCKQEDAVDPVLSDAEDTASPERLDRGASDPTRLERMFTGVVKHETTPRHEVLHRLGNANFGIPAGRGDPGADRNGDTADLPVDHPTVTRVQPRPHRHTEIADAFH